VTEPVDAPGGPQFERAEELLDRLIDDGKTYGAQASYWLMRWIARAREEAEDIWAEAESLAETQRKPPA